MLVKLILTIGIGIAFAFIVYLALADSLSKPSSNFQAIPPNIALSIVQNENNLTQDQIQDAKIRFVFMKGTGELYLADNITKKIGASIGKTSGTFTTGNHYSWEIKLLPVNSTYYVDHLTGEIISSTNGY